MPFPYHPRNIRCAAENTQLPIIQLILCHCYYVKILFMASVGVVC
jgi:hypothetical protein